MAVIDGARATAAAQGVEQSTRVIDMSDTIHLLDPNLAPLTAITMKLRKAHAISPKVEWLEDDYIPSSSAINNGAGYAAGDTSLVVDNGEYFRAGDVIKVLNDGEVMYVVSVSGDTLTVLRSVGATAASTLVDNEVLLVIGNVNQEFASKRTLKTTTKTPLFNYTQIWRWPFGASGTLQASELYGGDDLTYQTRKAGLEHRIQMERSFLFGEKGEYTTAAGGSDGNTPLRYCDGVIARITSNITTAATSTLTAAVMENFLRDGFRYGPAAKMLFASRLVVSHLNQIARASIETIPSSKSFPLALTEYVSGHGKCYIVTHNLLEGTGDNNYSYSGWALLLDLDAVYYRYLQGRDTKLRQNIQANDVDGTEHEYLTEACPMVIQEKNHAILNDAQTAG